MDSFSLQHGHRRRCKSFLLLYFVNSWPPCEYDLQYSDISQLGTTLSGLLIMTELVKWDRVQSYSVVY
jgi:hypothetical protein